MQLLPRLFAPILSLEGSSKSTVILEDSFVPNFPQIEFGRKLNLLCVVRLFFILGRMDFFYAGNGRL